MFVAYLAFLENGQHLEPAAETLIEDRRRERALAAQLVDQDAFESVGRVAVATLLLEQRVSGQFLPSLLPSAW